MIGRVKAQILLMGSIRRDGLNTWDLRSVPSFVVLICGNSVPTKRQLQRSVLIFPPSPSRRRSEICSNYSSDLRDLYEELFRKQLQDGEQVDYLGGFCEGLSRAGTKGADFCFGWFTGDILYIEDVFVEHPYRGKP